MFRYSSSFPFYVHFLYPCLQSEARPSKRRSFAHPLSRGQAKVLQAMPWLAMAGIYNIMNSALWIQKKTTIAFLHFKEIFRKDRHFRPSQFCGCEEVVSCPFASLAGHGRNNYASEKLLVVQTNWLQSSHPDALVDKGW